MAATLSLKTSLLVLASCAFLSMALWQLLPVDDCTSALKELNTQETFRDDVRCIKMDTYSWKEFKNVNEDFVISSNGTKHWKFEHNRFFTKRECEKHVFESKHHDDKFEYFCDQRNPHSYAYWRWYFVREDFINDDRYESLRVHPSEYDCSLGDITLTNALSYPFTRGHRDNRLCPLDFKGATDHAYGNTLMISCVNPYFYASIAFHVLCIMSSVYITFGMLLRDNIVTSKFDFDHPMVNVLRITLCTFTCHLPFHFFVFYFEPFTDTYQLSIDHGRIDGGVLNVFSFLHVPVKACLFLVSFLDSKTKAKMVRTWAKCAGAGSVVLIVVLVGRAVTSKLAFAFIVGCLSCASGARFWANMYNDCTLDDDYYDQKNYPTQTLMNFKDSLYELVIGWHIFFFLETLGVANNIPGLTPSQPWQVCVPTAAMVYMLHEKYIKPRKDQVKTE